MFPLQHIRVRGTRRSRTCCLPGFDRALIRMSLSSIASRREGSNLRRVDPNHACSRYTTSSRRDAVARASRLSHGTTVQLSKSSSRAPV